jgi:DNA-binding XRE family transcriptional regulator
MTNKLKDIRISRNFTQEEMSRKLNISLTQYRNIEKSRNTPSVEIAINISKILKCTVEDIFQP